MSDPIIDEVRCVRKKIEAEQGDDWDRLFRHLIEKQKTQHGKVISYLLKKLPGRDVA
jgi:hypothetical protein